MITDMIILDLIRVVKHCGFFVILSIKFFGLVIIFHYMNYYMFTYMFYLYSMCLLRLITFIYAKCSFDSSFTEINMSFKQQIITLFSVVFEFELNEIVLIIQIFFKKKFFCAQNINLSAEFPFFW